jgi:predicted nucleotidyltransferase
MTVPYGLYLKKAIKEKRDKRETLRKKVLAEIFEALDSLYVRVKFDEAFLFGSVTRPYAFNETSDVDIGFLNLKDEDFFSSISFLSERLGRDVDVVQLESVEGLRQKVLKGAISWTKKH